MYDYYQTIYKQFSECVISKSGCVKRVFAISSQWLAIPWELLRKRGYVQMRPTRVQ